MRDRLKSAARASLEGAKRNTMTFPQIVETLMQEGFESYLIDFRRAVATYYLPDGDSIELSMHKVDVPVQPALDTDRLRAAITEAQQQVAGYTYEGFCRKAVSAGCAGYIVSFSGRRVLYFGRRGEVHVEHFPQ